MAKLAGGLALVSWTFAFGVAGWYIPALISILFLMVYVFGKEKGD